MESFHTANCHFINEDYSEAVEVRALAMRITNLQD
jgi:hypothetical protein